MCDIHSLMSVDELIKFENYTYYFVKNIYDPIHVVSCLEYEYECESIKYRKNILIFLASSSIACISNVAIIPTYEQASYNYPEPRIEKFKEILEFCFIVENIILIIITESVDHFISNFYFENLYR